MGDSTGLVPRATTAEPCPYCGSSGHLPGNCPYPHVLPEDRRPRTTLTHPMGRAFDHELGCLVARGLGPSWRCTCGEIGPIYRSEAEARAGKREHEAEHR